MNFQEIGQAIAQKRKEVKLSQSELASKIGSSRSRISDLEAGNANEIGICKVLAMCEILGLELTIIEKTKRPTLAQLIKENNNA